MMETLTISNITQTQTAGLSIKTEGNGFIELQGNGFRSVGWPCDVLLSTGDGHLWFLEMGQFQFGPLDAGTAGNVNQFLRAELSDVGVEWQSGMGVA